MFFIVFACNGCILAQTSDAAGSIVRNSKQADHPRSRPLDLVDRRRERVQKDRRTLQKEDEKALIAVKMGPNGKGTPADRHHSQQACHWIDHGWSRIGALICGDHALYHRSVGVGEHSQSDA